MNKDKISARGVRKTYKNASRLDVLKDIDLNIKPGEFVAIQGPSGAGKSTLLHILGGLDSPTRGEVLFDAVDIYKLKETQRAEFRNKKVGFVFQFYHLLGELSALENVLLPGLLKSWWDKKESQRYAASLLDKLGLSGRLTHRPGQLSGGEQQRVAIARALMNKPQVLLCDEPTGNLDSENGNNILNFIRQFNKEGHLTVVMVTHDKEIASSADRIVHLRDGIIGE
ncbi:MAG: ABC transporter ATP-binding protein [Candidatus Omnitrophica bacterium]|nr:ABC transporter ATP-binding protein [Candidatus Omnitrophota bacterium]